MKQLKTRQICFFFIAFLPITKFFMMPSILASKANEDMWICSLINLSIDLITVLALLFTMKNYKKDYFSLLKENFGSITAKVIYFLYAIYFFIKSLLPIFEQKDYIDLSLYINSPSIIYFVPFIVVAFYLSLKKLNAIGRISDIVWTFTIIGFLFVFGLSISSVDFFAILPIGANGTNKIFSGSLATFNWYGDCVYLLFFMGNFCINIKDSLKITLCFILAELIAFVFIFMFYGIFKSIAYRQKFSLTELSKYSTVINSIGRFDYIGIFAILLSSIFAVALPLWFSSYTLSKVIQVKYKWVIPLFINLSAFILIWALNQRAYSLEKFMTSTFSIFFFVFSNIIPLLSVFLVKRRKKDELSTC